ncbi:hypothetical protein [Desulfoluna sp.]|uniref:hypothetical protein n=1 Tax=Desulfoluna sp. TaxID=2045199 RepID=UPI00260DAF7D|nr:hypothetical protein [Desulfoluna sp.]
MNSLRNNTRILFFLIALLGCTTGVALASDNPPIKMPADGVCDDAYISLGDVCVLPELLQGDPVALMEQIEVFKKNADNPPQRSDSEDSTSDDSPTCARYKKVLNDYLQEGILTYNPETGKMEKIRGEATEEAIQETRDYIETFCND